MADLTTSLIFGRFRGTRPFPRWHATYEDGRGGLVFRTFNTKLGCRLYARRLGRRAAWL
jgi:hypothetical protein